MRTKQKTKNQVKPSQQDKTTMTLDEFLGRELTPLADVVTFCNNLPTSLYADTTVVKSPEVVYRGLLLSHNRLISEEYLLNFRRSESDMGVVVGTTNYRLPMAAGSIAARDREENEEDLIALPPYQNERAPIGPVIRTRRSIRRYSGKAISLQELSTLLAHAAGITAHMEMEYAPRTVALGDDPQLDLRASGSGGALYPVDLFIMALNVDRLPAGAYRYLPKQHALKPVKSAGRVPELRQLAQFTEIEVEKAAMLIGYVYNFFENSRKYGEAGLGFAFIEAGAISAHIHLLCTALGLGSCDVGGFSKRRCERMFDADGMSRHMIHLTVVGR